MGTSIDLHWDSSQEVTELLTELPGLWLFADGGQIGTNKAPEAALMAYRVLLDGQLLHSDARRLDGPYTNNWSELMSVIDGLALIKADPNLQTKSISLATDSGVTYHRVRKAFLEIDQELAGFSPPQQYIMEKLIWRSHMKRIILLRGHPTQKVLSQFPPDAITGVWEGRNWHRENILCDNMCNALKT